MVKKKFSFKEINMVLKIIRSIFNFQNNLHTEKKTAKLADPGKPESHLELCLYVYSIAEF